MHQITQPVKRKTNFDLLKDAVKTWTEANGKEFSEESNFINGKYIIAKPHTLGLRAADARIGNRFAIVSHGESGTIDIISGFLSPLKLTFWMLENINLLKDRAI